MNGAVDSSVLCARVGNRYYSYAGGDQRSVEVNDPQSYRYKPLPCFDHCTALLDNKWYIFGGTPSSSIHVQEYDALTETWHQHVASGDIPLASCGVACSTLEGKVYTFGGCTSNRKYTSVLSELDVSNMRWKTLEPLQTTPSPLPKQDAAMLTHHNTLVTFGGFGILQETVKPSKATYDFKDNAKSEVWTNELVYFDLDRSTWLCPEVSGPSPKPCCQAKFSAIGADKAILLGGLGRKYLPLDTIKILDMSSATWNWSNLTSSGPYPPPRCGHCVVNLEPLFSKSALMMWGRHDMKIHNDAWVIRVCGDDKHCQWSQVSLPPKFCKPAFQCTTELVTVPQGKQLVRFGGHTNDKISPLDDTTIIDLASSKDGQIIFLTARVPRPRLSFDAPINASSGCFIEDAEYPQMKFFNQTQSIQLTDSDKDQEIPLEDIGMTLSIPAGAIPESESLPLQVRPVAYGNIEMPAGHVSHSPLFIITPLQLNKQVKITVEHNCDADSKEVIDSLEILGLDSRVCSDGKTSYKLKKITDAEVVIKSGDQQCEVQMKNLQSFQVGRKLSDSEQECDGRKVIYSVYWFTNPTPVLSSLSAILIVTQRLPVHKKVSYLTMSIPSTLCPLQSASDYVKKTYPELTREVVYSTVKFSCDNIQLQPDNVTGWDIESDKVIWLEEVNLPDEMEKELFDYPPHIEVCVERKTAAIEYSEKSSCELQVLGLTRDITLKLKLPTNCNADKASPPHSFPLSPPLPCSSSGTPLSLATDGSDSGVPTSPLSPRHYLSTTELGTQDLSLLHHILKEAANEWYTIGAHLEIPPDELEEISKLQCSVEECFLRMLVKWLKLKRKTTVQEIQSVLSSNDFEYLSSKLLEDLNSIMTKRIESDIKEVATNLQICTQYWEDNEMLCIAKQVASLIVDVQLSLRQPKQVILIIRDIKAQCQKMTGHSSVKLLITSSAVKNCVESVETFAQLLESLATSQLQTCSATEQESMLLLLQNIQKLSMAIQSLLKAVETASLKRHDRSADALQWIQISTRDRGSSVAHRRRELEQSG